MTYSLTDTGQENAIGILKVDLAFWLSDVVPAIACEGPMLPTLMTQSCRGVTPWTPHVALARCFKRRVNRKPGRPQSGAPTMSRTRMACSMAEY